MKIFLLYLLFFPLYSGAQIDIYNTSLLDSTKNQLYKFTPNYLTVQVPDNVMQILLKAGKSTIISSRSNRFEVVVTSQEDVDTIHVYSKGKLFYSKTFKIDTLPYPISRVANTLDTILSVKQIITNPFLTVMFPGSNFKSDWYILSFTTILDTQNGDQIIVPSNNNRLSPKQIEIIKTLSSGSKIYFDDVKGGGPNSRIVTIPSFTVIIK